MRPVDNNVGKAGSPVNQEDCHYPGHDKWRKKSNREETADVANSACDAVSGNETRQSYAHPERGEAVRDGKHGNARIEDASSLRSEGVRDNQ
jgi:hypothetical protein